MTVLTVFSRLGVKPEVFAIVFGESVLNDAVAIVLCRTVKKSQHPVFPICGDPISPICQKQ